MSHTHIRTSLIFCVSLCAQLCFNTNSIRYLLQMTVYRPTTLRGNVALTWSLTLFPGENTVKSEPCTVPH